MGKQSEPLTESYFYILMCLYRGANHGYGIMQMTEQLSGGRVKIGSGTMYGATSNMLKKGWITECISPQSGSERRRMYLLTDLGRQVFLDEYNRMTALTESARIIIQNTETAQKAVEYGSNLNPATLHT